MAAAARAEQSASRSRSHTHYAMFRTSHASAHLLRRRLALRRRLYRFIARKLAPGQGLDLANAMRLNALALTDAGRGAEAKELWLEARELYSSAGVQAGIDDANAHLADQG